jgi:hypothetical protein
VTPDAEFDRQTETWLAAAPAAAAWPDLADRLKQLRDPVLAAAAGEPSPAYQPFLLVVPLPADRTMPLTRLRGPGQVSRVLADLERFTPLPDLAVPAVPYALVGVERGEEFCGRVPTEAMAEVAARGRTPLTVEEGVALVLQVPAALEKNKCFSLAGSRAGDKRVPALWISRQAPVLGWCWAGNPHTWLGLASTATRLGVAQVTGQ